MEFINCVISSLWRTREVFLARLPRCAFLSLRLVSRFESWKRKWGSRYSIVCRVQLC